MTLLKDNVHAQLNKQTDKRKPHSPFLPFSLLQNAKHARRQVQVEFRANVRWLSMKPASGRSRVLNPRHGSVPFARFYRLRVFTSEASKRRGAEETRGRESGKMKSWARSFNRFKS